MTAAAAKSDEKAIGIRGADAHAIADCAVGKGAVMQGKCKIGFFESREQAVGQHGLGTGSHLFGWLGDEHQRALPLVLQANQCPRRSDPACHMNVMAAAMGHERFPAVPIGLVVARVGQAGFLFHR